MDTIETNNLPKTLKHRFANVRKGAKEYIARWFASIIDDIAYEIDQTTKITGKKYVFTEPVAGLSPDLLNLIVDKAIADEYWDDKWLLKGADGHLDEIILAIMDFRKMNRSAFKSRYPNSFRVWTPQDDEDLRTIYTRTDPENVDWQEFEQMFGRPANAIKIRLGRLGFALPEGTVMKY